MFAWLRGMTKWILMNRNRRIVTIIAFLNVLLGYLVFALFHEPRLIILMALVFGLCRILPYDGTVPDLGCILHCGAAGFVVPAA